MKTEERIKNYRSRLPEDLEGECNENLYKKDRRKKKKFKINFQHPLPKKNLHFPHQKYIIRIFLNKKRWNEIILYILVENFKETNTIFQKLNLNLPENFLQIV